MTDPALARAIAFAADEGHLAVANAEKIAEILDDAATSMAREADLTIEGRCLSGERICCSLWAELSIGKCGPKIATRTK